MINRRWYRDWIAIGLVFGFIMATCLDKSKAAPPNRKSKLPNIILIVADDFGYGDSGCYGQERIKTPYIDQLAKEGIRFTQAYAGSPMGTPSRCTLLTGKHTGHSRIRSSIQVPLEPDDVTIAKVLRVADYRTAAFGKWSMGWEGTTGLPLRQGFEEFFGFLEENDARHFYPPTLWRNDRRIELTGNQNGKSGDYAPDWFLRASTNFMRINVDYPFFLYFATTLPQASNVQSTNGMVSPSLEPYGKESWPAAEKAKAAMIGNLDNNVGWILFFLKRLQIDQETLIIFTSDNGPHSEGGVDSSFFRSSGPFRGGKRDLFEGGIRIPLIARWPGQIGAGSTNDSPVALWDILPTFADAAGVDPPKTIDGISLLPSMLGRSQTNRHEVLYWETHDLTNQWAVRVDNWKAVRREPNSKLEIYNLKTDPGESKNVVDDHPELATRIEGIIKRESQPWQAPKNEAPRPVWAKDL